VRRTGLRRASKIDRNQPEIVEGLRAMGCVVQSLGQVGDGCPDLLVSFRGSNVLLEVKMPGERLNAMQTQWHRAWTGTAHVVWSLSDAIQVMTRYGLKAA
jgi:hypothetical protein